ncbi:hypothetical protein BDB01DRAFT_390103 [Pilobolus umbonatus]|nr:hypothetical protein BDB01DRAFT_390103 [Pilobolus umbonatus]
MTRLFLYISIEEDGTACLVSNELKLLKYGETTDDWEVDDSKLIPCIVEEFYRMNEKNQHDELTENVFAMYIETVLKSSIRKEMFRFKKIKHCVVTLPDKWGPTYLDSMKQRLIESSVFDDLLVIKQSHSLIRHLQSPQYNHVFKNGEFYIVCYFKGVCEVTLYGYEIGPPIKGLKNIADHTVTEIRDFEREDFEEEYVVSVLFGGNKKKAAHYHLNVRELIEYSYNQYRLYPETTLFHIMISEVTPILYPLFISKQSRMISIN